MQWRETFLTIPGPALAPTLAARADGSRVMLGFSGTSSAVARFTTSEAPGIFQGLACTQNVPVIFLTLRDCGIMIQQDWFAVNQGGLAENATVFELLADTLAEVDAAIFGVSRNLPALRSDQAGNREPARNGTSRPSSLEQLYARIKGELWNTTRKRS